MFALRVAEDLHVSGVELWQRIYMCLVSSIHGPGQVNRKTQGPQRAGPESRHCNPPKERERENAVELQP
jgi:hypothetical protein